MHRFSLLITVSHRFLLFLIVSHRFSPFLTISHSFSPFFALSHRFSLILTASHCFTDQSWCTRGDAQKLMHQSLCTRGARCTRGDAPEERDAPAEMYQRRCIRKFWRSQNFLDSITGSNMPSALGLVVYFFPKWLRMFQNFSYKWHLRYQAFIWRRCYVSDFQHQPLIEAISERQTETHISSKETRFFCESFL